MMGTNIDQECHHRNLMYTNMDIAVVLGNGPSLRGLDFRAQLKGYTTFGCNVAYRYWDKIQWYPDYYACLDLVVGLSHKSQIARLIKDSKEYGIKKFLLRKNLIDELGTLCEKDCVVNFDELIKQDNPYWKATKHITTGSHITAWAATLGYHNILLLGIDAQYVEQLPEARSCGGYQLEMVKTPEYNPNYFFDDYQQQGDKYHIPNINLEQPTHQVSWEELAPAFVANDVLVINANMKSALTSFYKMPLEETSDFIRQQRTMDILAGPYLRTTSAHFDETDFIRKLLYKRKGTLIEVGAHTGSETLLFLKDGWTVHAFEPDDDNRKKLIEYTEAHNNALTIDERAVSDVSGLELAFYRSEESTGISSLSPFRESHRKVKTVKTISLTDYIRDHAIEKVDFLKVDAEGYDGILLKAFPFEKISPDFILCEFEDRKSVPLGYTMQDMACFLCERGYTVYVSEWYPINRYGFPHNWHRLYLYPGFPASPQSWGNLIAIRNHVDNNNMKELANSCVKFLKSSQKTEAKFDVTMKNKKKRHRERILWYMLSVIFVIVSFLGIFSLIEKPHDRWIPIILDVFVLIFIICSTLLYKKIKRLKKRLKMLEDECIIYKHNIYDLQKKILH